MTAFFVGVEKDLLGFGSQMQFRRLGYSVSENDPLFDLTADGIDGKCVTKRQESRRYRLVFTHQPEQNMLRRNGGRSVLQCFVPGEENYSARAFGIAFEHKITAQAFTLS